MARGSLDDAPSAVVYGAVQSRDIEVRRGENLRGELLPVPCRASALSRLPLRSVPWHRRSWLHQLRSVPTGAASVQLPAP